jgi:hypothetical protein
MNNNNLAMKSTMPISSNIRTIGSGRLKRPSKELVNITTSSKKPFLKEYSIAMVLRLVKFTGRKTPTPQR